MNIFSLKGVTDYVDQRFIWYIIFLLLGNIVLLPRCTDKNAISLEKTFFSDNSDIGNPPMIQITYPNSGQRIGIDIPITFHGTASDPEDRIIAGSSLVWISFEDDQLGTGDSITVDNLRFGSHTIILSAHDSDNNVGADTVAISIDSLLKYEGSYQTPGEAIDVQVLGTYAFVVCGNAGLQIKV